MTYRCGPLMLVATLFIALSLLNFFAPSSFVLPAAPHHVTRQSNRLRGQDIPEDPSIGTTTPLFRVLAMAVTAVGYRMLASPLTRHAVKTKKKAGVRIIDGKEIPWNLFKASKPYKGRIVANETLTTPTGDANWETCHVTIDHDGNMPYLEGQSIGIISPGPDKKGQSPAKMRLYSIASSSAGDDESSTTVSLCVKRHVEVDGKYVNREVGQDVPDKSGSSYTDKSVYRGVCSNHVCDLGVNDEVMLTGPVGAELLLPEDQNLNIIMVCTGTGIAPMRSYLRKLFHDSDGAAADGSRKFKGTAWLFLGVPYSKSILYHDEHVEYKTNFPDQFRYDYAVSREQVNDKGEKMYIQRKIGEYSGELWNIMQKDNTHVIICGLKGMESGMAECFGPIAEREGRAWSDFERDMKKAGRYHVEVY